MRLMLVCAMAITLPSTIDSSESTISMPCQSNSQPCSATPSRRSMNANAASFGAVPISSVTAVGAPWYTSGTHMWYGAAPSLNAMPGHHEHQPEHQQRAVALPAATTLRERVESSEPVAP